MWGSENHLHWVQAKKAVLPVENLKTVIKPTKTWSALIITMLWQS